MAVILMFGVKVRQAGLLGFLKPRTRLLFCVRLPQRLSELPAEAQWNCTYEYGALPAAPTVMNCGVDANVTWEHKSVRIATQHFVLLVSPDQLALDEFATRVTLFEACDYPVHVTQFEDD